MKKTRQGRVLLLLVMLFTVFAPQNGVSGTAVQSYGALTATECAWQPGQMLIPGGSAFGIKLFTKGVVIVGTTDVQTAAGLADPAAEAGLEPGDVIISIDGSEVNTVEETKEKIGASAFVDGVLPMNYVVTHAADLADCVTVEQSIEDGILTGKKSTLYEKTVNDFGVANYGNITYNEKAYKSLWKGLD